MAKRNHRSAAEPQQHAQQNPETDPRSRDRPSPVTATTEAPEIPLAAAVNNPESREQQNPRRKRRSRLRLRAGRKKKTRQNPVARWAKLAIVAGAVVTTGALGYGIYHKVTTKKKTIRCGEKYRHLAVTVSGQTLDDPYGMAPTRADYEEWLDLAKALVAQANDRFKELGDLECEATGGSGCGTEEVSGGSYPRWDALVPLQNQMDGKLEELDSFWNFDFSLTYIPAIQKAQAIVVDALCLMEKSDAGIQEYGGQIPVTPSVELDQGSSSWKWFALGGGAVIALGGIGYALGKGPSSASSSTPHSPSLPTTARATRPE